MSISYFKTVVARNHFIEAYNKAMKQLPEPSATFDLPNPFGTVRVYKFGNHEGIPIVLLPGRSSSTPMWNVNLPGLMAQHSVYSIDLLGEPGKTEQTISIDTLQQQADWIENVILSIPKKAIHKISVWKQKKQSLFILNGRVASNSLISV